MQDGDEIDLDGAGGGMVMLNTNKCLNIGIKPKVSCLNMTGLLVGFFLATLYLTLMASFTPYLLEDEYGVSKKKSGGVSGNLALAGDICAILTEFTLGYLMDLFGRKTITVTGMYLAAGAVFSMPLPRHIGGLYFVRCLI